MDWLKLVYVLAIAFLFVPLVFMGANVFFPDYTGTEAHYLDKGCYRPGPIAEPVTVEQREFMQAQTQQCLKGERTERIAWEKERNEYWGWKYSAIVAFNLAILILVLLFAFKDAVVMGLFTGTIVTVFIATMRFWESARSKLGFALLLITFFVVIYFINKRHDILLDRKKKK